jgi:hypothetical protein
MRYLAIAEYVEPGPLLPPQQVAQMVERLIIPSFEALAKLEDEKKVLGGGVNVGARGGAFILEVASEDEANRVLQSLPFWGLIKWTITPLQGFRQRAADQRAMLQQLKVMV